MEIHDTGATTKERDLSNSESREGEDCREVVWEGTQDSKRGEGVEMRRDNTFGKKKCMR